MLRAQRSPEFEIELKMMAEKYDEIGLLQSAAQGLVAWDIAGADA